MPVPVILDCISSPYSCLKPVPINAFRLQPGFWADRLKTIQQIAIPMQYDLLEKTGRLDNFRRIHTGKVDHFQGYFFNDSDVYKWLEAACWSLAAGFDEQTQKNIDEVIEIVSASQARDGYLNTYFTGENKSDRWENLRDMHELYCAGHLIQAAIAHHRVTGQVSLLTVALDLADHICKRFLDSGVPATPGHPEIEMALVELYRSVDDKKYLHMAQSFLDQRGYGLIGGRAYHLDHRPFRELERLEGHAVRAMYLCCGASDIYLETGEKLLYDTLDRIWRRLVSKQMYVTGGVGSRHERESLGSDFELPNERAYAETCAAIGSMMWNWRMLHALPVGTNPEHFQPDVRYADQIEWTLYNAVLPGIGLGGQDYHYVNPLEVHDSHERQAWFDCACCPTNIIRLFASVGGYFYSQTENNIWIHQYSSTIGEMRLNPDLQISLSIETDYPWGGEVEIEILSVTRARTEIKGESVNQPVSFGIHLRIPAWLQENIPVYINNHLWQETGVPGTYAQLQREWSPGDKIHLEFPMHVRFLECHPYVQENLGRIAVSRGPILYCIEAYDNPKIDPRDVHLHLGGSYVVQPMNIGSSKIICIQFPAGIDMLSAQWMNSLYQEIAIPKTNNIVETYPVRAIPYFAWGNRGKGWMQVWLSHL